MDYILAGETQFLLGWLLPHGSVEIPAILIAGQAGIVLAGALIGWGSPIRLRDRFRAVANDLITLIGGVALFLVWAGLVEAFMSQYHEPVLPYEIKIAFGTAELILLFWFLSQSGSRPEKRKKRMTGRDDRTNRLLIKTPEGVVFSLLLAGPISRFLAWLVDITAISAAGRIVGAVLQILGVISPDAAGAIMILAYFVISVGYGIALEWYWRGQTLGKRLLRLRVMDVHGLRLQFSQVVIRNLLRFVDNLPVAYMVGGLFCLITRRSQRLGDLAANTIVVRNPQIPQPDLEQLLADKYNSFHQYPHLEARLRQNSKPLEAEVALAALLRRDQLDPAARIELFKEIAGHFKEIVAFPPEAVDGISDEQYVRNVVDVLFRSGQAG